MGYFYLLQTYSLTISGTQLPLFPSFFNRSILVSSPVRTGERLTSEKIRIAIPRNGMCPSFGNIYEILKPPGIYP